MLIIWPASVTHELAYVNEFVIVLNQDNVFNHFIQLKIFLDMLEKTSLASHYNLTLPIQDILGADLPKLEGKDI